MKSCKSVSPLDRLESSLGFDPVLFVPCIAYIVAPGFLHSFSKYKLNLLYYYMEKYSTQNQYNS